MAIRSPVFGGLTIPGAAAVNAVSPQRPLVAVGARSLIPVTYGQDRVPALIVNVLAAAGQAKVVLVQCLWGHACTSIADVLLNDRALPPGVQVSGHYSGSQGLPDPTLVAAFSAQGIVYADALQGFAYSVLAMPAAVFDGQLGFSALITGRAVYDPRKDDTAGGVGQQRLAQPQTWAYSDNPALCAADWCSNAVFGAGVAVDWAGLPDAANANDELIGAPPEKRRILGLTLADAAPIRQVAEAMRMYAGCWMVPGANGMRLVPDRDAAPVAVYSHDAGQISEIGPLVLRDLGNSPTAVEVIYTDRSQVPWRDAVAEAKLPGAGVGIPWRLSSVRLPGVARSSQALREANERLNKLTLSDLSTNLEVFDSGVARDEGDIVSVSHPVGLAGKLMRVTAVDSPGPGRWRLSVSEHDPAVYSDDVQTVPTYPDVSRVVDGAAVSLVGLGLNTFRAVAVGYDAAQANAAPASAGLYANGVAVYGGGGHYRVAKVRRSDADVSYVGQFDVRGNAGAPAAMAAALNGIGPDHIVVVWTYDEPRDGRLTGGLEAAMYRCGASRAVFGSPDFQFRAAYILVGIPGAGEGNGAEAYQGAVAADPGAWCELSFSLVNGVLTGVSGAYTPRSLSDYGYTGDFDATRGAPSGTPVGALTADQVESIAGAQAKANAAQAAAIIAAKSEAQAIADLAEIEAKAYADGLVTAEEARAIADAQARVSAAKAEAVATAAADATAKANVAALTATWSGVTGVNVTTEQIIGSAATEVVEFYQETGINFSNLA